MRKTLLDCDKLKESSIEYRPGTVEGVDLREPFVMDSMNGAVPPEAYEKDKTLKTGMRKVTIPDLPSMKKMFFMHHRGELIAKLQALVDMGVLQKIVGYEFLEQRFNRSNCIFGEDNFYRIDREHFYMEMRLILSLKDIYNQNCTWQGYIRLKFDYSENNRDFAICNIGNTTLAESGLTNLDNFLIPVMSNKNLDEYGEELFLKYDKEAYYKSNIRSGTRLAKLMGLNVLCLPVHDFNGIKSAIFFKESKIYIKPDVFDEDSEPQIFVVPPNTIVVNTNIIMREYSDFYIYHECIHYELHYLFFASQDMACSNLEDIPHKTIIVGENEVVKDKIYFVEQQADRGAYALMMPITHMKYLIDRASSQVRSYRHAGERYEQIGMSIVRELALPRFRVRARMIQLGHWQARGCLIYVDNRCVPPFAFSKESVDDTRITFVIDRKSVNALCYANAEFRTMITSGEYVYAEGHVVLNDPQYIRSTRQGLVLTEEAKEHVDDCCLRFIRIFIRNSSGKYILGRLNFDSAYMERVDFYIGDTMKKYGLDDLRGEEMYLKEFPDTFEQAFMTLMEKNEDTMVSMEEKLHLSRRTIVRWIQAPERFINYDFIIMLMSLWKIPDFIVEELIELGEVFISKKDERNKALAKVRRTMWNDPPQVINKYLIERGFEPLTISRA